MPHPSWKIVAGDGPLVAAAIHSGHAVRDDVARRLCISAEERLREEDPFTDQWAAIASNRVIGLKSRFEFDLNRPRDKAVYLTAEDAWGLEVWKSPPPPQHVIDESLAIYDQFYDKLHAFLGRLVEQHKQLVVYDLHSYNHQRPGPQGEAADAELNPEINLGTGTMDRRRWEHVVGRFLADLRALDFQGRRLDVRENVKFFGGHFPGWIHQTFPDSVCVLSIEVKKTFMNEWTGEGDAAAIEAMQQALASTVAGVLEALGSR